VTLALERPSFPTLLGKWGMQELVEPRLRSLVANHLGVAGDTLGSEALLGDDLSESAAPDAMTLAALVEREFAIALPERALDDVRSYSALVDTVVSSILARREAERSDPGPPTRVGASLVDPAKPWRGTIVRRGRLTPYLAETIAGEARVASRGSRLELTLDPSATDALLAVVLDRFTHLARRGIAVSVRRDTLATEAATQAQLPPAA
jgi:hypothetical protein